MRFLIFFSIILLPISFTVVGGEIPTDKNIIVFPSKLGHVTFKHKLHAGLENVGGLVKVECNTCHHTYKGEGPIKKCGDCHVKGKNTNPASPPGLVKAFHYRCRSCHKYTMEQGKHAGPNQNCLLCHIR